MAENNRNLQIKIGDNGGVVELPVEEYLRLTRIEVKFLELKANEDRN